jgi:subtilisin family serine protease
MATVVCGESTNYGKGVAPHAQLISIRVEDDLGVINTEDVAWALVQVWLDWEPTHRIAAVNLSLAANPDEDTLATNDCIDPSPLLALLIDLLSIDGIPVVAGTGNDSLDNKVLFPACFALTFAVGATNKLDGIEDYSNSSDALDLLAPGTGVTIPSTAGFCELKAGTSVSTAFVSAAFALLRERWPTRSLAELEAALKQSGPSLSDKPDGIVRNRLDVSAAMQLLETIPPGGPQ